MLDSYEGETLYTYDALGQLLSETKNPCPECSECGTTVNITYDNYGNITSKNGASYTYGNVLWHDRLTGYGDKTIFYDAQGNPTNYLGHNLTWEKGRQLKSFDGNTYTYNSEGIRTSKTVDNVRHDYVVDGGRILKETWNGNTLIPVYNSDDEVVGIYYNCTPYYFYKNLQGDVIGISDNDGRAVVTYSYDAWGVCAVLFDNSGIGLADINPYRYRSYYYDTEIGMYYLQSRYYDPVVGRFVNSDDPIYLGSCGEIIGLNLFAYCANEPVNNTDSSGNFIARIVSALIGAMIGAAGYLVGFFIEKYILKLESDFNVWLLILSIAVGAIDGALSISKMGKLLGFVVTFLMDFITSLVGGDVWWEALICAFLVAIVSMCLSGNKLLSVQKNKAYTTTLLKKLKKRNWEIIKKAIRTYFRKIHKHLKQYMTNSAITAIVGVGSHTGTKGTVQIVELVRAG